MEGFPKTKPSSPIFGKKQKGRRNGRPFVVLEAAPRSAAQAD
jgi:hypothetical protein